MDADILDCSVVVPCFNEAAVLPEFFARMDRACAGLGGRYEIVFVNDGSTDGTWPLLEKLCAENPQVTALDLSRNHGHQLALSAGLAHARGRRVLVIDADLQDPPELLPAMWQQMDAGADVVYGQRQSRDGETAFKRMTASVFYRFLQLLTDEKIPRDAGDFRLINRAVLDQLLAMPERDRYLRGMVNWVGFRQEPIVYARQARSAGESKYPLPKMIQFAADAVTSFSIKPLRLAIYLSLSFGSIAFVLAIYSILEWFVGHTIRGWTSLIVVVLLLGSAQLFVLGIIGEYLGRIIRQVKMRPLYIVRKRLN